MKMLRWILLPFLLIAMAADRDAGVACIAHQIERMDHGTTDFAELRESYGVAIVDTATQFSVAGPEPCAAQVTYTREGRRGRVSGIYMTLESPTSLAALQRAWGSFNLLPPTPAGKFSALAICDTGNAEQTYAIIAESRSPITDRSQIDKVAIRVDYTD